MIQRARPDVAPFPKVLGRARQLKPGRKAGPPWVLQFTIQGARHSPRNATDPNVLNNGFARVSSPGRGLGTHVAANPDNVLADGSARWNERSSL
jgi:hypothetical protein